MSSYRPYQFKIINGLSGDPAVYLFIPRTGEGILFDLGDLSDMSHRDLLKVRHVFVSHTHMDHFVGFDRLLRVNVPHRRRIYLYGPLGLAANVRHKILGYTWNLIDDEQVNFEVCEIDAVQSKVIRSSVSKATGFQIANQRIESWQSSSHLVTLADHSQVFGVSLNHKGIPSIAYQIVSPVHSKIRSERMEPLGLKPGPWLKELQSKAARNELDGGLSIEGRSYPFKDLVSELVSVESSYRFCYITDISFDSQNLQRLKAAFPHTSCVLSECSFADKDYSRAVDKAHLTSKQAALIAAYLEARELELFHISNIYNGRETELIEEAREFFSRFKGLSTEALKEEICGELKRCEQLMT